MGRSAFAFFALLAAAFYPDAASASQSSAPCSAAKAEATTVEAINRHYSRWAGRCVSVRGLIFNDHLFADREATLEPGIGYADNLRGSLYIQRNGDVGLPKRPVFLALVGTVGSCADAHAAVAAEQAADPGAIIMVSGYCHTSMENFIVPVAVQSLSHLPVPRLTEAQIPVAQRPLVEVPAEWLNEGHLIAAEKLVKAMVGGDAEAYAHLVDPLTTNGGWSESSQKSTKRRLQEAIAEFEAIAPLRQRFVAIEPLDPRQRRVFAGRAELDQTKDDRTIPSRLVTCWCVVGDCAGRWPIAVFDADNDTARPYLCVETSNYVMAGGNDTIQAEVPLRSSGFAEPALSTPPR